MITLLTTRQMNQLPCNLHLISNIINHQSQSGKKTVCNLKENKLPTPTATVKIILLYLFAPVLFLDN